MIGDSGRVRVDNQIIHRISN